MSRAVGPATDRNRAKRRLRHALDTLRLETEMDYVIIADHNVVTAPFDILSDWLEQAVKPCC